MGETPEMIVTAVITVSDVPYTNDDLTGGYW